MGCWFMVVYSLRCSSRVELEPEALCSLRQPQSTIWGEVGEVSVILSDLIP